MKLKFIFPIAFSTLLTAFTTFSVLDTLVLEKVDDSVEVDDNDENFDFTKKPVEPDPVDPKKEEPAKEDDNKTTEPKKEDETKKDNPNVVVNTDPNGDYLYKYDTDDLKIKIFKETVKTKHMTEDRMLDTVVFCADVQISDASHFRTRFAKARGATKPTYGMNITNKTSEIAVDGGAVFAINGDYYGAREKGYVVRNGKTYRDYGYSSGREDLVVWQDGSFDVFEEGVTKLKTITDDERGAWQVFSFGPALVTNSQVHVKEDEEVTTGFSQLGNQRTSIGIYSPLHYFIAICDGRLQTSYGMSLFEMGTFMQQKGVKTAYNLDGGGSATMWFDGKVINTPNSHGEEDIGERKISDIIFFK